MVLPTPTGQDPKAQPNSVFSAPLSVETLPHHSLAAGRNACISAKELTSPDLPPPQVGPGLTFAFPNRPKSSAKHRAHELQEGRSFQFMVVFNIKFLGRASTAFRPEQRAWGTIRVSTPFREPQSGGRGRWRQRRGGVGRRGVGVQAGHLPVERVA